MSDLTLPAFTVVVANDDEDDSCRSGAQLECPLSAVLQRSGRVYRRWRNDRADPGLLFRGDRPGFPRLGGIGAVLRF